MSTSEKAQWFGVIAAIIACIVYIIVSEHPAFIAGFVAMALYFTYVAVQQRSERKAS